MTTATGRDAAEIAEAYDEERPARRLSGRVKTGVAIVAGAVSVYALYAVFQPVATLQYRMTFLAVVLPLVFLVYRPFLKRTKPT
ncbi:MAG: C4-dicarboxylate ABC transporter permease, partial [Stackebrandtia sp.]